MSNDPWALTMFFGGNQYIRKNSFMYVKPRIITISFLARSLRKSTLQLFTELFADNPVLIDLVVNINRPSWLISTDSPSTRI